MKATAASGAASCMRARRRGARFKPHGSRSSGAGPPSPGRCRPASSRAAGRAALRRPWCITAMRSASAKISSRSSRDQQHRRAAPRGVEQLLVHVGHRADVQAPGRLVGDDQRRRLSRRVADQRAAEDQLLHVAAGQRARRRVQARDSVPRTSKRSISCRACACAAARRTKPARENAGVAIALEHRVLPHRQVADHAHRVPVLGDARDAGAHPGARPCAASRGPCSCSRAGAQRDAGRTAARRAPAGRCRRRRRWPTISPARSSRSTPSSSWRPSRATARVASRRLHDRWRRARAAGASASAPGGRPSVSASSRLVGAGRRQHGDQLAAAQHGDAAATRAAPRRACG